MAFGQLAELRNDLDEAATRYRAAVAEDARNVAAMFQLGVVLRHQHKFDDAAAQFDKVAAADKDYPGLALERGMLFEESGNMQKAIELFQSALEKAPDDPDLLLRVAAAYVTVNDPDKALAMLDKVLTARGNSAEAHHYKGRALMEKGAGSQADAYKELARAVQIDPNRAEYHLYLGWEANEAIPPQLDVAKTELDKALDLDGNLPEAYWQRGVLECKQGALDDGVKDERKALALKPTLYQAHAGLAACDAAKNDRAAAFAEWSTAVNADMKASVPHPEWRYRYGAMLMEQGNTGAATAYLQSASDAASKMEKPTPNWVYECEFDLAEALHKSGRDSDACAHYTRFLDLAPVNSPDHADAQARKTATCGHR
jgi:tetratricopeptide (TPR) repeat protein